MMRFSRRRWLLLVAAVLVTCLAARPLRDAWRTVGLMLDLGAAAREKVDRTGLLEHDLRLEEEGESRRARLYRPLGRAPETGVVFLPGLTPMGVSNPRFVAVSRALARSGYLVVAPDIESLRRFRLEEEAVDEIGFWCRYLRSESSPRVERVGLVGVSVAGTLALLATARQSACADPAPADWPGLRARRLATARQSACADPAFVVCIGGYQDLFRCSLQWFSPRTSRQKHGKYPVQYYGKWILMLTALDAVEKPEDRIALELVLRTLLEQARPPKGTWKLTTQGERWYRMAVELNPNDAGLQKEIEQHLTPRFEALSVRDDLKSIRCPVFLVHGDRDELIPPTETLELQRRLTSAETHLLLTPLISHTHSIMSQLSTKERWTAFLRAGSFIHALAGVS